MSVLQNDERKEEEEDMYTKSVHFSDTRQIAQAGPMVAVHMGKDPEKDLCSTMCEEIKQIVANKNPDEEVTFVVIHKIPDIFKDEQAFEKEQSELIRFKNALDRLGQSCNIVFIVSSTTRLTWMELVEDGVNRWHTDHVDMFSDIWLSPQHIRVECVTTQGFEDTVKSIFSSLFPSNLPVKGPVFLFNTGNINLNLQLNFQAFIDHPFHVTKATLNRDRYFKNTLNEDTIVYVPTYQSEYGWEVPPSLQPFYLAMYPLLNGNEKSDEHTWYSQTAKKSEATQTITLEVKAEWIFLLFETTHHARAAFITTLERHDYVKMNNFDWHQWIPKLIGYVEDWGPSRDCKQEDVQRPSIAMNRPKHLKKWQYTALASLDRKRGQSSTYSKPYQTSEEDWFLIKVCNLLEELTSLFASIRNADATKSNSARLEDFETSHSTLLEQCSFTRCLMLDLNSTICHTIHDSLTEQLKRCNKLTDKLNAGTSQYSSSFQSGARITRSATSTPNMRTSSSMLLPPPSMLRRN